MRSKYIRFFISSTFKDMELERNFLQEVFDELIPIYKEKGWQIEIVDLRWGISEEAGLDNRTMRICKKELAQCMKLSPKPNFIILSGNRYGWTPLPETISMSVFSSLFMSEQENELFHKWYYFDENALPNGEYVLQRRTNLFRIKEYWETNVEKPLGKMFGRNSQRLNNVSLYGLSATEQEIRQGALSVSDAKEHVLAYIRDINKKTIPTDIIDDYYEKDEVNRNKQLDLQKKIRTVLSKENIVEYEKLDYRFLSSREYKDKFKAEMGNHIMAIIDNVIGGFQNRPITENERHIEYAIEKSCNFVGRENDLELIDKYLLSSDIKPLWIKGPSGIGKSTLLAKIVDKYKDQYDIICRFCGTTEDSSDAVSLVASIQNDLDKRDIRKRKNNSSFTKDNNLTVTASDKKLPKKRNRLFDHPILLIIDALDQVYDDNYKEFKKCSWITTECNQMIKILYSSLEDGFETVSNKQSFMLTDMGLEAELLLYNQLKINNRTISKKEHRDTITKCLENSDKSPLFVYLLSQYLLDKPSWRTLRYVPSSIKDLVNLIITDLSQATKHGEVVVRTALSLLAIDRIGLSDTEMLWLLSNDKDVYNSIIETSKQNKHEIRGRRLPTIIWIRLNNDLKAILRSQMTDVGLMNTIFHKGIREILEKRYRKDNNTFLYYCECLNSLYSLAYVYNDKHSVKELAYSYYMLTRFSTGDERKFYIYRKKASWILTSKWDYISKKKHLFPISLLEDYDRTQGLFLDKPNKELEVFRNELYRIKDPVKEEHVVLYLANLPDSSPVKQSISQSDYRESFMENVLSVSKVEAPLYYAREIGESPCMSEDGTRIASLFKENKEVRINNLTNHSSHKIYRWEDPVLEMICDETITLCAIRTAKGCYIHDIIGNKILVNVKMSKNGWMSLSADGLSFACGENGSAYIYYNHQYEGYLDKVRIAKMTPSGLYIWVLFEDGCLFRYAKGVENGCSFPIKIKNEQMKLYNPLEASNATITACSDERCCCRTPTATLNILHYIEDNKDKFVLKYGNLSPVFAYADDCQQFIDVTGRYWIIDDNGNEQQIGQFYLNEQLCCINKSFTKALSTKDLRVFDFKKEIGNYNISNTFQTGKINHAQCCNDGSEIVVSVGMVFGGPFAGGGKTEALRYSSKRMYAWTPDSDSRFSGIYSSAVSPNGMIITASVLGTPSQLIICNAKHNNSICKIDIPKWQTGCTDIIYSSDSSYVLAITGDYVADPSTLFLYVITGSGQTLLIKEWGWEYNRNSLCISNNNRFLFLLCGGYAIYDLIEEREIIDDAHRLPYSIYTYFQDIAFCTVSKDFLVMCQSINVAFSSDEKNDLLYRYDMDNYAFETSLCAKVIIGCSSTGRHQYYLDKEKKLYIKDWLRSDDFEHLIDDVLWVVPALDERHVYITLNDYTIILYNILTRQIEQKAYRGMTTHQQACAQGLMTVSTNCEVSMYKAADYLEVNAPAVTTFVRRWNLDTKQKEEPSAVCPMCGWKIEITDDVKQYLKQIPQNLHYEDWDNPGLFGHICPHCKAELQFNPYIV